MSKSLKRVYAEAEELSLGIDIIEVPVTTKTAQQAADAMSVNVDQIAKSIIFRGESSNLPLLFLTAGGNRVDMSKASTLASEALIRADAAFIRATTGFAIGGVSPLGHLNPVKTWFDTRLLDFKSIWAAAGTPNHMFKIDPDFLAKAIKSEIAEFTE